MKWNKMDEKIMKALEEHKEAQSIYLDYRNLKTRELLNAFEPILLKKGQFESPNLLKPLEYKLTVGDLNWLKSNKISQSHPPQMSEQLFSYFVGYLATIQNGSTINKTLIIDPKWCRTEKDERNKLVREICEKMGPEVFEKCLIFPTVEHYGVFFTFVPFPSRSLADNYSVYTRTEIYHIGAGSIGPYKRIIEPKIKEFLVNMTNYFGEDKYFPNTVVAKEGMVRSDVSVRIQPFFLLWAMYASLFLATNAEDIPGNMAKRDCETCTDIGKEYKRGLARDVENLVRQNPKEEVVEYVLKLQLEILNFQPNIIDLTNSD